MEADTTSGDVVNRLKTMIKSGIFGQSGPYPFVRDNNGERPLPLQFISDVEFFRIGLHQIRTSDSQSEDYKTIWIVVKTPTKGNKVRQFVDTQSMFFNEVYFYSNLLQLLTVNCDSLMFPKCFYSAINSENRDKDIVITEDVNSKGYSLVGGRCLDLEHLKLTLNNLGRFHGLSYKAKKESSSFLSKVGNLKPIKFDEEFDPLMLATTQRGIIPLLGDDEKNDAILKEAMIKMAKMRRVVNKLKRPEEPFAVLCHGDFNKNNVLFSYDEGRVRDTIFVDFQMSSYSDPTTDIAHILYANANQNQRDSYWEELLHNYWEGVVDVELEPGFTFDEFLDNFGKKSIYGYVPASIFLPATYDEEEANESIEEFLNRPLDERIAIMEEIGGDDATEALVQIVRHLVDKGYVHKFVQFCESE